MHSRSMKAPRIGNRVSSLGNQSKSLVEGASKSLKAPPKPPKGFHSSVPLLRGFCFSASSGRVSFMPFAGEPKSAEIQALSDRLTTWSSMRANEYLLSLACWMGQKRERGGSMGIAQ